MKHHIGRQVQLAGDFEPHLKFIAENNSFNKTILKKAISETFENRGTDLKDRYLIFDATFKNNHQKQTQWTSFIQLNKLNLKISFYEAVAKIESFIEPIFKEETQVKWNPRTWKWE